MGTSVLQTHEIEFSYLSQPGRGFSHSCCLVIQSCLTLCNPMDCSTPHSSVFTFSWSLLKLMSIESVILSKHLIPCHSFLLLSSIFPSIQVFSSELALCIRWPKYWCFSISLSNDSSGLIFFQIDCLDTLTIQGTLKSLLQYHNSKASVQLFSAQSSLSSNSHICM